MHDPAVETPSPGHHGLADNERAARSAEKKSPVGSTILVMIVINVLLWAAMYWGVQRYL
jgi:hypothetical protein